MLNIPEEVKTLLKTDSVPKDFKVVSQMEKCLT